MPIRRTCNGRSVQNNLHGPTLRHLQPALELRPGAWQLYIPMESALAKQVAGRHHRQTLRRAAVTPLLIIRLRRKLQFFMGLNLQFPLNASSERLQFPVRCRAPQAVRGVPLTKILKAMPFGHSGRKRQNSVKPVEGLDRAFLIHAWSSGLRNRRVVGKPP
jgi:hypothetical protein